MDDQTIIIIGLVFQTVIGAVVAAIFTRKNRSGLAGFAWGFCIPIVGLILAIVLKRKLDTNRRLQRVVSTSDVEQLVFLFLLLALFGWAFWQSLSFPGQAQTYPRVVGGAAVLITAAELIAYIVSMVRGNAPEVAKEDTLTARFLTILPYLLWLAAYYAVIYVIGMVAASGLFVFLFLLIEGKVKWYYALPAGLFIIFFLIQMEDVMSLRWPRSIIDPIEMLGWH